MNPPSDELPTANPVPSTSAKFNWKSYPMGILTGFVIASLFGGLGLALNNLLKQPSVKNNTANSTYVTNSVTSTISVSNSPILSTIVPTSSVTTKTGTEIVSLDNNYSQYNNYNLGFSIKFPKSPNWYNDCDTSKFNVPRPTQIVEDLANKVVYVAFKTEPMWGTNNVCQVKTVDLNLIKNGIPFVSGSYKDTRYPESYAFKIRAVNSDTELLKFANDVYINKDYTSGKECSIGTKTIIDQVNKDYSVRLNSNSGPNSYDDGTKCPLNFNYTFLYSESNKLAITYAIGQEPPFGGDYVFGVTFIH